MEWGEGGVRVGDRVEGSGVRVGWGGVGWGGVGWGGVGGGGRFDLSAEAATCVLLAHRITLHDALQLNLR